MSYAIGTEVWKELFQVNTSDAALHVESHFLWRAAAIGSEAVRGVEPVVCVCEALALVADSGSVLQRSRSLSVSACGSASHTDLRASNPQNFQRFSSVAPTPLNSCLNMLGNRTISLSSSLAEIWKMRHEQSKVSLILLLLLHVEHFGHKQTQNCPLRLRLCLLRN